MNNQPQPVCYDEDEIDLREVLRTILRYKTFIILFTLAVTLAAGVYAYLKTPIYEIKADVQVGYVSNSNSNSNSNSKIYLIDPPALKLFILNTFNDQKKAYPKVSTTFVKGTKDILNITVDNISNESAKAHLQTILNEIKRKEDTKLQAYTQNIKAQIKILQEENKQLQKQLPILYKGLEKVKEPFIYQVLLSNIKKTNDEILNIRLKINELKDKISPLNITRTNVIGEIKQQDSPIKPKRKLIVTVAFVTGLILAIFLVFFFEFVKGMKEEEAN